MCPVVRNAISQAIADGRYIKLTDSINALADVTISGVSNGDTMYYDSGQWKNNNRLKNDVSNNQLDFTGQLVKINDNHATATGNRNWLQIYNRLNQLRFEVGSIANGNPQIRFNVIGNTRIGFPTSDPTYFAFLNDYSDFWLANSVDPALYFNFYNGNTINFGWSSNTQVINFYTSNISVKSGNVILASGVNIACNITLGNKIGTSTSQKIGFWNATPVIQQVLATGGGATVDNVISLLQTLGLCKQS